MALKHLHLSALAFVDDVYCADGAKIAKSGFWVFKHLCRQIRFVTSRRKTQVPATIIALLGAEVSPSRDEIRDQAGTQRVLKIKGHIAQALHLDGLTPASAIKLRGELGSYTSLLMGKLGRCMMAP